MNYVESLIFSGDHQDKIAFTRVADSNELEGFEPSLVSVVIPKQAQSVTIKNDYLDKELPVLTKIEKDEPLVVVQSTDRRDFIQTALVTNQDNVKDRIDDPNTFFWIMTANNWITLAQSHDPRRTSGFIINTD